jgi:outer membrane lipase/esterase
MPPIAKCLRHGLSSLTALIMLAGLAGQAAQAGPMISAVYFFGDSMTDSGNAGNLPPAIVLPDGTVVPVPSSTGPNLSLGYYATPFPGVATGALGRFSNGPVWPEYFAGSLGLGATAAVAGGTNFAVGGAVTSQLALEIAAFQSFVPTVDPNALFSVLMGANDIIDITRGDLVEPIGDAVNNVLGGVLALKTLGAQNFLVPTLPDIGLFTQFTPAEAATATALTLQFNTLLLGGLTALGLDAITPDLFTFTNELLANPSAFGLTNIDTPCLLDPVCQADPQGPIADQFLFFDDRHATTAVHALIADQIVAAVAPVSEPPALPILALAFAAVALRHRPRRNS